MSENLSPFQFSLFMRAGDLADPAKTNHGDRGEDEPISDIQDRKVAESHGRSDWRGSGEESLYDSIQRTGVRVPVQMTSYTKEYTGKDDKDGWPTYATEDKPLLENGHHRVFSANEINPNMEIPVRWQQ